MSERIVLSYSITLLFFLSFLSTSAFSTKSRLSSMGDLSIVIEDESNMINLWDFAGNPTGFLEDEPGNVIRSDFLYESYKAWDIPGSSRQFDPQFKLQSNGDMIHGLVSMDVRKEKDFGIEVAGSYFARQSSFITADYELTHPDISLVLCKQLNPKTFLGVDLAYVEYTSVIEPKLSQITTRSKTHYFRTQVGGERKLSNEILLAILLGYDSIDSDNKSYTSNYYTFWASFESIVQINSQLKLGFESVSYLRRADFHVSITGGNQNYFFSTFRLRGIYNLTTDLRMGVFYSDNEVSTEFFHPLESFIYPISSDVVAVSHLGFGISYQLTNNVLTGLEYHFKNTSHPHSAFPYWGLAQESLHLGMETILSPAFILRAGYVRTGTDQNPSAGLRIRDFTRGNIITLGIGYHSSRSKINLDLAYSYSFKKYEEWYLDWDVKSKTHLLSLSLKKTF